MCTQKGATPKTLRPSLVWAQAGRLPVKNDPAAALRWLSQYSDELGHGAFTPVFDEARNFREFPILVFTLKHAGIRLHDAEVWICFDDAGCAGLLNRVPAGLDVAPAVPDKAVDPCYYSRREASEPDRLIVAEQRRSQTGTHDVVEFLDGTVGFARELTQRDTAAPDSSATFTVFNFGGFPDQLAADSRGVIWCSDPTLNRLLEIDPLTGTATFHATSPWGQPDGLCVDDKDRVWTGLYTAGDGLGMFDRRTNTLARWAPPPSGSELAIPAWQSGNSIFVTEHGPSRLHEFDLATSTWKPSLQLPAGGWPVESNCDTSTGDLFVTLYSTDQIGIVRNSSVVGTPPTPLQAGPAFCDALNGKLWFSYWLTPQLGELDVASGIFTTYNLPVAGGGGPMDIGPNGHVFLGVRGTGYILEFDPKTGLATPHAIPSSASYLKDGLIVAPDGTVWFASGVGGNVVRLTLP